MINQIYLVLRDGKATLNGKQESVVPTEEVEMMIDELENNKKWEKDELEEQFNGALCDSPRSRVLTYLNNPFSAKNCHLLAIERGTEETK